MCLQSNFNLFTCFHGKKIDRRNNVISFPRLSHVKYKGKGDVLILGDLNARAGNEDGLHGKQLSHPLPDIKAITLETGNRCSSDVKVNSSGRKLLTICSSLNLEMANGQTPGDRLRDLTCFSNKGQVLWTT